MTKLAMNPQPGDILFTRIDGPFSWLLRVANGSFPYSHACLIGEDEDGETMVYTTGARHKHKLIFCFGKISASKYLAKRQYVLCRYKSASGKGLSPKQQQAILDWCKRHTGTPYPFYKAWKYYRLAIHGLGLHKLNAWSRHHGEVLCYESVAAAYRNAGIELNPRANNKTASAYDIKEIYYSPYLKDVYTSVDHTPPARELIRI